MGPSSLIQKEDANSAIGSSLPETYIEPDCLSICNIYDTYGMLFVSNQMHGIRNMIPLQENVIRFVDDFPTFSCKVPSSLSAF